MSNASENPRPMYAGIDTSSNEQWTRVFVALFGRKIERSFTGGNHRARGEAWVAEWETLLEREWLTIRETAAHLMQDFTRALKEQGVEQSDINVALGRVQAHVKA